jgi:ribosome-associated protein
MAKKILTRIVIDALEDIKAKEIKLYNVMSLTSEFDYIAVASADSTRQTKALANNVIDMIKENGFELYGLEGEQTGEWVLVDCGDVVVHIMQPAVRDYYKLEELWQDGKLEFPAPKVKRAAKPATAPAKEKKAAAKPKAVARKKPAAGGTRKKATATATSTRKKATTTAKKPVAKKPAAKKPAAKKPATTRRKTAA